MPGRITRHQRPRRAIIGRLWAYEQLRNAENPRDLGQVDWLLWGHPENPYTPGTRSFMAYNAGYDQARQATPRPAGTRINLRRIAHEPSH